jgi:hypothetical protein
MTIKRKGKRDDKLGSSEGTQKKGKGTGDL